MPHINSSHVQRTGPVAKQEVKSGSLGQFFGFQLEIGFTKQHYERALLEVCTVNPVDVKLFTTSLENSKQYMVITVNTLAGFFCSLGGQLRGIEVCKCLCWEAQARGTFTYSSGIAKELGAGTLVEVFPDGVVVHSCSQRHKHVPDGVRKRDDAVRLEEKHT